MNIDSEVVFYSFEHFFSVDWANASVHCADVKYSPITFRLAEALHEDEYYFDHPDVAMVWAHRGKYEEDKGR